MSAVKENNNRRPLKGINIESKDKCEEDVSICQNMRNIAAESNNDSPYKDSNSVTREADSTSNDGIGVGSKSDICTEHDSEHDTHKPRMEDSITSDRTPNIGYNASGKNSAMTKTPEESKDKLAKEGTQKSLKENIDKQVKQSMGKTAKESTEKAAKESEKKTAATESPVKPVKVSLWKRMQIENMEKPAEESTEKIAKESTEKAAKESMEKASVKESPVKPVKLNAWKRIQKSFLGNTATISKPKVSADNTSLEGGSDLDSNVDLRSVPISLNEHDAGFHQQINVKGHKVLMKWQRSREREEEKFRRQEERLKAYTTVYDPLSGKMFNYHELWPEGSLRSRKHDSYFNV